VDIRKEVDRILPHRVVAIGGDGTIKLIAEAIMKTKIPLGIIPAGSANGLAKELLIPADLGMALKVVIDGNKKAIHLLRINDKICIHLSDIGLNAYMVKRFEAMDHRGMWAYLKAAFGVFWTRYRSHSEMDINQERIPVKAYMIVFANATRYGTGALINPIGSLSDHLFEVVVILKLSLRELLKMWFTHEPYHPKMTRVIQTDSVKIRCRKPVHFQVDGEYIGKVTKLEAEIIPDSLEVMVGWEDQGEVSNL